MAWTFDRKCTAISWSTSNLHLQIGDTLQHSPERSSLAQFRSGKLLAVAIISRLGIETLLREGPHRAIGMTVLRTSDPFLKSASA